MGRCTARPGHKIAKTTPCKVEWAPGSQHSCRAASGAREENGPSSRPPPDLIPLQTSSPRSGFAVIAGGGRQRGRANVRPMTGSVAVSKDGLQYRFVIPGTRTTVWRLAASDAFLVDSSAPKPSTITTYKKGPAAYRTFFEAAPGSRGRKLRLDRRVARRQQITRRGAWRRPIGGGRPRCMNGHEDKRSGRRRPVSARARWRALHGD